MYEVISASRRLVVRSPPANSHAMRAPKLVTLCAVANKDIKLLRN